MNEHIESIKQTLQSAHSDLTDEQFEILFYTAVDMQHGEFKISDTFHKLLAFVESVTKNNLTETKELNDDLIQSYIGEFDSIVDWAFDKFHKKIPDEFVEYIDWERFANSYIEEHDIYITTETKTMKSGISITTKIHVFDFNKVATRNNA